MAKKSDLTQRELSSALDAFIATVQETLSQDENVSLVGFGTFEIQELAARTGRNTLLRGLKCKLRQLNYHALKQKSYLKQLFLSL